MSKEFIATLAEMEVAFRFNFKGTGMLFRSFWKKEIPEGYDGRYVTADINAVSALAKEQNWPMETAEYNCLMMETADYLAELGTVMFHGVAFCCGSGAYILTAPSGTGKSTQYRNMKRLYRNRVRIINGDKPFLKADSNGRIIVYPSPWKGKENWGSLEHAPLRGLVLLEQGQNNFLKRMDVEKAALPLMEQFLYTAPTRESVHMVCRMADSLFRTIPLYHFENKGDLASSQMLFECIEMLESKWQKNI